MPPAYGPNQLKGRPRRRACEQVRALRRPCGLCGYPIDQSLPRWPKPHPLSSVVDEWIPRRLGGSPTDLANLREMHRRCNGKKHDNLVTARLIADCIRDIETYIAHHTTQPLTRTW